MAAWEYTSINLNNIPIKIDVIDVLNDAGKDGWELVAITGNNISYLRRQIGRPIQRPARPSARASST